MPRRILARSLDRGSATDHLSPGYFRDYRLLLLLPSPSSPSGFRPAASTPSRRIHTYRRKLHFVGCKGSVVKIVTPATLTTLARFEIAPPSINNIAPTLDRPFAKRHSAQRFYAARPSSRDPSRREDPSPFLSFVLLEKTFRIVKRDVVLTEGEISLRGNREEVTIRASASVPPTPQSPVIKLERLRRETYLASLFSLSPFSSEKPSSGSLAPPGILAAL